MSDSIGRGAPAAPEAAAPEAAAAEAAAPEGAPPPPRFAPVRVGIIGCGNISGAYLTAARNYPALDIRAVADLDMAVAGARAAEHGVPQVLTPEQLLDDPELELVINLTVPSAHAEVSLAALERGKSVYSEKPLATEREDGRRLLQRAAAHDLRLGCAPDTFLGGGLQTCRKLLDEGAIGRPFGVMACMVNHGMEHWHPNPAFFYQRGAGPLFDVGVYYLTAMVALLGPVARVASTAGITFPERTILNGARLGQAIAVTTPTHIAGLLKFEAGVTATLLTSFDVWGSDLPRMEIYGTEGTLSVPDPNTFGGPVRLRRGHDEGWTTVPLSHGNTAESRGLGAADLAAGLRTGAPHRASGALAFHVLDVMQALLEAADGGGWLDVVSRCERPAPLPADVPAGSRGT